MKDRDNRKPNNQILCLQITTKLINNLFYNSVSGQLSVLLLVCLFLMFAIIFLFVGFLNENEQMTELSVIFQR